MINGQDETTANFLDIYKEKNGWKDLEYHQVGEQSVTKAEARNLAAQFVKTQYLGFLCEYTEVPEHYLTKALEVIQNYGPDAFGGPDLTHPDSSYFEKAVGGIYTSGLAKGPNHIRHSLKHKMKTNVTTVKEHGLNNCNLWFKSEVFHKHRFAFDSRLKKNEERVLLHKLISARRKVCLVHDFYVYNRRSSSLKDLIKQSFVSGRYLTYSFFLYPKSFDLVSTAPLFLLIYLLSTPFLLKTNLVVILYLYTLANIYYSMKTSYHTRSFWNFPVYLFMHVLLNITHGIGALTAILRRPKKSLT